MNTVLNDIPPIACDLTALPASVDRKQLAVAVTQIFQAVQEVHELPSGYAFRFLNEPGMWMALAQFVEYERRCCPFYAFALELEPNGGPIWLRMTGGEGVKSFLESVFGDLHEAVRRQLIRTAPGDSLDEAIAHAAPILAGTLANAVKG
jgi:hypothetical protein